MNPLFNRLLVALDGSKLAELALPVAATFARMNASEITLLHVIEPDAPATIHGDRHIQNRTEATAYLAEVADRLRQDGAIVKTTILAAGPHGVAATIAEEAVSIESDLVFMATHGQGGIRDLLFGRVAQKVVQLSTRPLVIVPATEARPTFVCQTMVVPLDGTQAGEIMLPVAQSLAQMFRCRIVLIRVVPTPGTLQGREAAVATLLPSASATVLRFEESEAGRYLQATAAAWFPQNDVAIEVRRGQVESELMQTLASYRADLAVMSTHGRGGLSAFLDGSIGQRIMSRARCPIVLLRTPE